MINHDYIYLPTAGLQQYKKACYSNGSGAFRGQRGQKAQSGSHDGDQEWQSEWHDGGCYDGWYDPFHVEEEYGDWADYDDDSWWYSFEEDRQRNDEDVWESSAGAAGNSAGLAAQHSPEQMNVHHGDSTREEKARMFLELAVVHAEAPGTPPARVQ